jgi:hypothetical protein
VEIFVASLRFEGRGQRVSLAKGLPRVIESGLGISAGATGQAADGKCKQEHSQSPRSSEVFSLISASVLFPCRRHG